MRWSRPDCPDGCRLHAGRALDTIVAELLTKHGLTLRLSRVIYHQDL